jgi:hypothetical protein
MSEASDISVAGEGGGSSISWISICVFSGDFSFLTGLSFSFHFFSLIILAHEMMGLRRFDDYVRLMTKGEGGYGRVEKRRKSKLQLKLLRYIGRVVLRDVEGKTIGN